MKRKPIFIIAFVVMVLAQLYVPASMIFSRERTLSEGSLYKFRTAPIDPTDPFRGKYVSLTFRENRVGVSNLEDFPASETIYVTFKEDRDGYAQVDRVLKNAPDDTEIYLETTVSHHVFESDSIVIDYPFDRFYMEESKAYEAEKAHRQAMFDEQQNTYALVAILDGHAVISDVFINDKPLKEAALERLNSQE